MDLFENFLFTSQKRATIFLRTYSISAGKIASGWSLQVVQSPELATVYNIRLDPGRILVRRERHHVLLREKGPQAERAVAETQKHTRRKSSAGA